MSCKVKSTWPATMPCSASARDHSLASAICPIAAEAWLSSSLSAPLGEPGDRAAKRDRAGGHDNHARAALVQGGDVRGERFEPFAPDGAEGAVDQER